MRFVETAYTITEGEGDVEVCVNLTRPTTDILDNFVGVDVYRDDTSLYVPSDVMLASELRKYMCRSLKKQDFFLPQVGIYNTLSVYLAMVILCDVILQHYV